MTPTRFYQCVFIASTLSLSWLGMQIVHELGHVACAWVAGERVERVVLHPLTISRTDSTHDRHPRFVAWGGALVGVFIPLGILAITKLICPRWAYLLRFFAGSCLIANGIYLAAGSFHGVGDAGDLLRHGASRWTMIAFGFVAVPAGLAMWHGLGPHFGLGAAKGAVNRRVAMASLGLLVAVVLAEILLDSR